MGKKLRKSNVVMGDRNILPNSESILDRWIFYPIVVESWKQGEQVKFCNYVYSMEGKSPTQSCAFFNVYFPFARAECPESGLNFSLPN